MSDWLVDKSAWSASAPPPTQRSGQTPSSARWCGISTLTRLEVGFSARTGGELRDELRRPPLIAMPVEYLTPAIEDRAVEVQGRLAERGHHRAPGVPDLLIAATAELVGLVVLHGDKDFELIADVTGQWVERLAQ